VRIVEELVEIWPNEVCDNWVAMECSQNDGSKTQYYIVILDRLQDCSGGLEWALESRIRGLLTGGPIADSGNFNRVHRDLVLRDNQSEVLNLPSMKLTLLWMEE